MAIILTKNHLKMFVFSFKGILQFNKNLAKFLHQKNWASLLH